MALGAARTLKLDQGNGKLAMQDANGAPVVTFSRVR
jgi:hypothetical protein